MATTLTRNALLALISLAVSLPLAGCAARANEAAASPGSVERSVRVTNNWKRPVRVVLQQGEKSAPVGSVSAGRSELFRVPAELDGPSVTIHAIDVDGSEWVAAVVPEKQCAHLPQSGAARGGCEITIDGTYPGTLRSKQ